MWENESSFYILDPLRLDISFKEKKIDIKILIIKKLDIKLFLLNSDWSWIKLGKLWLIYILQSLNFSILD